MVDGAAPAQGGGSEWTLGKTSLVLAGTGLASLLVALMASSGTFFVLAIVLFLAGLGVGVAAAVRTRQDPASGPDTAGVVGLSLGAAGLAVAIVIIVILLIVLFLIVQFIACLFTFGLAC